MAAIKLDVIPFDEYPDKVDWPERYRFDPDTRPHDLPPLTPGRTLRSTEVRHRQWFCRQYFTRRGYNIPPNISWQILSTLRIDDDGSLVDDQGRIVIPINSMASLSPNATSFLWDKRRRRWNGNHFEIIGSKNDTLPDLFEAAIQRANSVPKPNRIMYDKRLKYMSFKRWIFEYTRGRVNYFKDNYKLRKRTVNVHLKRSKENMSNPRIVMACILYPFMLQDPNTFKRYFDRPKENKFMESICFNIAYGTMTPVRLRNMTNFMCWQIGRYEKSWAQFLTSEHFAPPLPLDQSQQVIRSFPACAGIYDSPAQSLVTAYNKTTFYGMINTTKAFGIFYVFRDLSYPARVFPYLGSQDIEFTDEDREWNIQEVFDHRLWDPYETSNWQVTDTLKQMREKNKAHVREKIKRLLKEDPSFFATSCNQIPGFVPQLRKSS